MQWLNYHHLLYFWVVAREGSITHASQVLHLAQPTISSQLQKLEQNLGGKLFQRVGRGLKLTDLGQTVYRYADEIFALGNELVDIAKGRSPSQPQQLAVGVSDTLAKLMVYRLLLPALRLPQPMRLYCREGAMEVLLGELASFELDVVLSDAPVGHTASVKAFNHLLGECGVTFFANARLAKKYRANFPQCLAEAPLLLPAAATQLRRALDLWFDEQSLRPSIMGEFQDSALMKVFGQEGLGLFPAPTIIADAVCKQYAVQAIGQIEEVREHFYAISVERRLKHPAVVAISNAAKTQMFATSEN